MTLGNPQAYGDASYWDNRYRQDNGPFDWYQQYSGLAPLFHLYIPKRHRILMVGCGNAVLSEDMVNDGYQEIVNVDISSVVIEAMQKKYQDYRQLKYEKMDVRDMSAFENSSFDSVVDKGMLDSLMCGPNAQENVSKMLEEIRRVLKPGGVYILITYGGPHVRMPHVKAPESWTITLHVVATWWQSFGGQCPQLQKFAVRVLSQPCSASGCERNWSVFERIHTKKRNRLEQKRLNDLVFVQYNLRLRRNQLLNKRPDTDPIVLDDVDPTSDWVVETEELELDVDFDLEVEALLADEPHDVDVDPLLTSTHGVDPVPDMPGSSRPPASGSRRKGKRIAVEDDLEDSDSQPEEDYDAIASPSPSSSSASSSSSGAEFDDDDDQ